ncbi:hypothetical protein H5P28_05295 [Ruficoccus amylovorans]|uniref:Sialate O-acetylesterase domain-containing protein n=1 Tax=Ruficoccus amylovorans TaxID=1804625 RepID=A0A842HB22_9BACT|nr:hypothetical protein [Ruficoccus amylovorans]MBC2593673.1 hypothetical protein [Ruficoccus amylovorans]
MNRQILSLAALLCAVATTAPGAETPTSSVLIMHYGQSNAGITPAGGSLIGGDQLSPGVPVFMPEDGKGTRGLMGKAPSAPMAALVPAVDDKSSFYVQSVVLPAGLTFIELWQGEGAPAVLVRSEAKGGQPFLGEVGRDNSYGLHTKDGVKTQSYLNLVNSIKEMVALAQADGMPVQVIYIPFTHQEADRGLPGEVYLAQMRAFMADVEADLAPLNIPVVWLLDQAGGTTGGGSGGNWPNRLVLQQAADESDNIYLIGPRYPYPIFDNIHWTNQGKAMYGELLGYAISQIYQGKAFEPARLENAVLDGATIRLSFKSQNPLVFDESEFPIKASVKGFTLNGVTNGAKIESADISGPREVTVTLDKAPEGKDMTLRYAYRPRERGIDEDIKEVPDWAISNGALREDWSRPSRFVPGKNIYKWVPAFECSLGQG